MRAASTSYFQGRFGHKLLAGTPWEPHQHRPRHHEIVSVSSSSRFQCRCGHNFLAVTPCRPHPNRPGQHDIARAAPTSVFVVLAWEHLFSVGAELDPRHHAPRGARPRVMARNRHNHSTNSEAACAPPRREVARPPRTTGLRRQRSRNVVEPVRAVRAVFGRPV